MILQAFLKNSERFLLLPHRGYLLIIYNGKPDSLLVAASGVDFNAAAGDMTDIPGFIGRFPVGKHPADFKFPLFRNNERIFEYF